MAITIVSSLETASKSLAADEELWITRTGSLICDTVTNLEAVSFLHSSGFIHVEGSVYGEVALSIGTSAENDVDHRIEITQSGVVSAHSQAMSIYGNAVNVSNFGLITAELLGIYTFGISPTTLSTITNTGTIQAKIAIVHDGNESFRIINTGLISGSIASFSASEIAGVAKHSIINAGTMIGDIKFGGGTDSYDGRGGTINGIIFGNDGADTFIVGSGEEVINGGAGTDTLDFRSTGGIQVALDGRIGNTGTAAGDTYTGIERVFGSAGNDVVIGDTEANSLFGLGGKDNLEGDEGADYIVGGRGVDTLKGGLDNDRFVFLDLKDAGDLITDFTNTGTNNDAFNVKASAFGGGLVAGALLASQFQSRADNMAQDSNDRFIFRTTDKTLWFDADGSGAGAALMLADLQASATLTFADIILT